MNDIKYYVKIKHKWVEKKKAMLHGNFTKTVIDEEEYCYFNNYLLHGINRCLRFREYVWKNKVLT